MHRSTAVIVRPLAPRLNLTLYDPPDASSDPGVAPAEAAEFEAALTDYKRRSGRMFPTWSEVLEVLRGLGYAKPGPSSSATSGSASDASARSGRESSSPMGS